MTDTPREPRLERRRLAELVSFPRQHEFFGDLPDQDLEELGHAMRRGGVPPIEVLPKNRAGLPPNTILRGHARREAAERSGLEELEVLVRYDLARASPEAIEREFLADNVHRRHLDPLSKAHAALRIYELDRGREGRLTPFQEAAAREHIAKLFAWSGRTLLRYWTVLRGPKEIQDALREGKLPLVLAARVAGLSEADQAAIVARIIAGEAPKSVVADHLAAEDTRRRNTGEPVAYLMNDLERVLRLVEHRLDEMTPHRLRIHLRTLQEAQQALAVLIARAMPAERQTQAGADDSGEEQRDPR